MRARVSPYSEIDRAVALGEDEAVRRLTRWAEQNSGSRNRAGLADMFHLLEADLGGLGGDCERVALAPARQIDDRGEERTLPLGDALRLRKRPEAPIQVLLVGHMDTVFGEEHPFQAVAQEPGTRLLRGPGVADAKGGLAVAALALQAFEQLDEARRLGWELWITPDEELGSPGSAPLLHHAACGPAAGLVYEPAQLGGDLVGARKGSGNYTLVVRGHSAHAGRDPERGRNAIALASRAVVAMQGWNSHRSGVTVNVGEFHGGTARNVVPDLALVRFNVRGVTRGDQAVAEGQLQELMAELHGEEGFSVTLHGGFTRPPRPLDLPSVALLEQFAMVGAGMGVSLRWRDSGGVSDANILAAAGLPALDGLGPIGEGLHTDGEYIHLDSVAQRARLSGRFLAAVACGELRLPTGGSGGSGDGTAAR